MKKFDLGKIEKVDIRNISINTHEINSCPRGEIGRHKGLKSQRLEVKIIP